MALVSNILTQVFITLIAVAGVYVLTGLTGMFSLGQAAFMAIGSYASGLLVVKAHMPLVPAIIIAVVLLAASVACFFQIVKDKDSADVSYNRNELLVMLGAAAIILCTSLIGLVPSCLIYILLWLKLVEHAPWKAIITIEIIMAAIILGVFTTWLQIRFPVGLLGSLLGL